MQYMMFMPFPPSAPSNCELVHKPAPDARTRGNDLQ